MRVFIRVESGVVLTLWVTEESLVSFVIDCAMLSGRILINRSSCTLWMGSTCLLESECIGSYKSQSELNIATVLLPVSSGLSFVDIESFTPSCNNNNTYLNSPMSFKLTQNVTAIDSSICNLIIDVRGRNDLKINGILVHDSDTGYFTFTSSQLFTPSTQITVFIFGKHFLLNGVDLTDSYQIFHFSTTTHQPISSTVFLSHPSVASDPVMIPITISSNSPLTEFRSRLLSKFKISKSLAITVSCDGTIIENSRQFYDFLIQRNSDTVIQLSVSCTEGTTNKTTNKTNKSKPVFTPLPNEEYLQRIWVNEESGCYAIVGKMTLEEETALLLAIISSEV